MQNLATNGFLASDVEAKLLGRSGSVTHRFRVEVLDSNLTKIRELIGKMSGYIEYRADARIHKSLSLTCLEQPIELDTFANYMTGEATGYWRLGETGGTPQDEKGNFSGTFNGGYTLGRNSLIVGDIDTAVELNGTTGYINFPTSSLFNSPRAGFLIFVKTLDTNGVIASRAGQFTLAVVDSRLSLSITIAGSTITYNTMAIVNDGEPHQLGWTYDGSEVRIIGRGDTIFNTPASGSLANVSAALTIGKDAGGNFLACTVDEAAWFTNAITPAQARLFYQASQRDTSEINFYSDYLKVFAGVKMDTPGNDGSYYAEWPQGVFMPNYPPSDVLGGATYRNITAFDRLQLLAECDIGQRFALEAGITYTEGVRQVMGLCGIPATQINIVETTTTLSVARDWIIGTNALDIANALLTEINYLPLWADENGIYHSRENVTAVSIQPSATFRDDMDSMFFPEASHIAALPNARNVIIGFTNTPDAPSIRAEARNDLLSSPISTVRRKRELMRIEEIKAASQTEADAIVGRWRYEEAQGADLFKRKSPLYPLYQHLDVVNLEYARLRVNYPMQPMSIRTSLVPGELQEFEDRRVVPALQ